MPYDKLSDGFIKLASEQQSVIKCLYAVPGIQIEMQQKLLVINQGDPYQSVKLLSHG